MILERKDGTRETLTEDEFLALLPSLNPTKQVGNPTRRVEMTDQEVADAQARAAAQAAQDAVTSLKQSAAATLAAYQYQGVTFPLTEEKLAYYKGVAEEAAAGLLDGQYPVQLIGSDGLVEAADAAAIAAAYADMKATALAVQVQLGNQLKALGV